MSPRRRAAIVTLGCSRNEADSEELAGRLAAAGWQVEADASDSDVVLVNTCGFIAAAKQDSIDTILAVADEGDHRPVVAVGCMAQRYGRELASQLPEADAVLGFDHYSDIGAVLDRVMAGEAVPSHSPADRRKLLPVVPVERPGSSVAAPGHAGHRLRLGDGPMAPLKIGSGCDRRCAFCSIPLFRGSAISRSVAEISGEAQWLLDEGVKELYLVSENSTSYGKDLPETDLPRLLAELDSLAAAHESRHEGSIRIRTSYLQPAEIRAGTIEAIAGLDHVASYFDLPFQHANGQLLRSMRRFGSTDTFMALIAEIRRCAPQAGIRTNFIVGFPGESEAALQELVDFIAAASFDAVGVFGYSDEEGTAARLLPHKLPDDEIRRRVDWVCDVVDDACAQRAADRVGQRVRVLVEGASGTAVANGRAAHQGPEDGEIHVRTAAPASVGSTLSARVEAANGVDLLAVEES